MRVSFALVVWGAAYVQDFLDFSLPTLLAEGNLVSPKIGAGSRFQILTTPEDFARIQASPLFSHLKRVLPVDFVDIGRVRGRDKYHAASRCQVEAIRRSEGYDAVALLYPDIIWSRGAIQFAIQQLSKGALAFLSPGPAVLPEPTLVALQQLGRVNGYEGAAGPGVFSISPCEVANIALLHHHPMWKAFDWDGNCFTNTPACLRWNVGDEGWLIRCFHLHPVMLRVQQENPRFFAKFNLSLDAEYVARLFDGKDRLSFANNTSDFAIATVRSGDMPPLPISGSRANTATVARWAESNAMLLHRSFAGITFRWHRGELNEALWRTAEARSRSIIEEVFDRLHTPDTIVRVEDPIAYRARIARRRFSKKPEITLPPSLEKMQRSTLAKMVFYKVSYGAVWQAAMFVRDRAIGRWLLSQPLVTRLWLRVKPWVHPRSEVHAALSVGTLFRRIARVNDDKSK